MVNVALRSRGSLQPVGPDKVAMGRTRIAGVIANRHVLEAKHTYGSLSNLCRRPRYPAPLGWRATHKTERW